MVNKLIVEPGAGNPVLRYDLRDKVKLLTGALAADNGIDILEIGRAKVGTPYGVGWFEYNIEKFEESTAASGGFTPTAGNKLLIATITVKNVSRTKPGFGPGFLVPKMLDENGDEIRLTAMAKVSGPEPPTNQNREPEQQVRFRFVFQCPASVKLASLLLRDLHSARRVTAQLN